MAKNEVKEMIDETVETATEMAQELEETVVKTKKPGFFKRNGKKILTHGIAAACGFGFKVLIDVLSGGKADVSTPVETTNVGGVDVTTF